MARSNNVEMPGGESPDSTGDALQTAEPQQVTFSVTTATREQILEHFSHYQDAEGESVILDADFSMLVDMALKPQRVEIPLPAATDGKAPHRAPVLTDKGWVV
ncbi:hypothetical protein E1L25_14145 [Salmonella enterica subsp. enterica serovar Newport]|nr:hypothetical protein [Salmonella enterica subsp. enterica serovar Newport]